MNWLRKINIWVILLFINGSLLLIACSSLNPPKICTLIGCLGGISIDIPDLQAGAEYQVRLLTPSGNVETVTCGNGNESVPFDTSCTASGAFFALEADIAPPETITIEVIIDGVTYSREFQPEYEKSQPNGAGCSPVCYSASINFEFIK